MSLLTPLQGGYLPSVMVWFASCDLSSWPAPVVVAGTVAASIATCYGLRRFCRHGTSLNDALGLTRQMVSSTFGLEKEGYDTVINVIVQLKAATRDHRCPSKEQLAESFKSHACDQFAQFSRIPTQTKPLGPVTWSPPTPGWSASQHIFATEIASSTGDALAAADAIVNRSVLNVSKATHPWWECHLIPVAPPPSTPGSPPLADDDIAAVLVIRVHHGLGDGTSLVAALAPMFSDPVTGTPLNADTLFDPARFRSHAVTKVSWPIRVCRTCRGAWTFCRALFSLLHQLLIKKDTAPNPFQGRPLPLQGQGAGVVFLPTHSLAVVQRMRKAAGDGTTVNDLEFALFAGAARRFWQRVHELPPSAVQVDRNTNTEHWDIRALTPFAVPALAAESTHPRRFESLLGNRWTFVVNRLPVHLESAMDRLNASRSSWANIKAGFMVTASFFLTRLCAAVMSQAQQRQSVVDLAQGTSVVFSNVRGPPQDVALLRVQGRHAGFPVRACHIAYPNFISQVILLSVGDNVHVCFTGHGEPFTGLAARALLQQCWSDEFDAMRAALNVS